MDGQGSERTPDWGGPLSGGLHGSAHDGPSAPGNPVGTDVERLDSFASVARIRRGRLATEPPDDVAAGTVSGYDSEQVSGELTVVVSDAGASLMTGTITATDFLNDWTLEVDLRES